MSEAEQYMTQLIEARINENHIDEIEEEKAESSSIKKDVERLQQQLYEATAMHETTKDEMLEDRIINLLRGARLSLQSYTRIRNVLNQCVLEWDKKYGGNNEYPSKDLVDNFIKKFYNHFGMVEPEETKMDFIKEREMEIY